MRGAYYNEIDPIAAQWLRNLIAAGHIAPGEVDERDIRLVRPDDLAGYRQCHFFAGIGVWSYALRLAGWQDEREVWTGSCPCQPFSDAGAGGGFDDERHLWPVWFELIRERRPVVVLGEQVASAAGLAWLDAVHADLEAAAYSAGAVDLCAAGVGAPHIRQRLFFVADQGVDDSASARQQSARQGSKDETRDKARMCGPECGCAACVVADTGGERIRASGRAEDARAAREAEGEGHQRQRLRHDAGHEGDGRARSVADAGCVVRERWPDELRPTSAHEAERHEEAADDQRSGATSGVALGDAKRARLEGHAGHVDEWHESGRLGAHASRSTAAAGADGRMADANGGHSSAEGLQRSGQHGLEPQDRGAVNGFWRDADWLACIDGKARPVEPGTFPLAHGATARVGRLRAYGNAIVAPVAAEFIRAYLDVKAAA